MSIAYKNIFVVDDDVMMTVMLRDHLQRNPRFKVTAFYTGEDCIKNLHLNPQGGGLC